VKDSGKTEIFQRSCVEEKTEQAGEDTVILGVAVPRGWRDFLYAYPRWHAHTPRIRDSLDEELREMVRAEIVMLIDEIWTSRPDISAELVKKYSLQDIDPSKRRSGDETAVPHTVSTDISLDEALKAHLHHVQWLADRLPAGGVVPVAGDVGIMVLEEADREAGTSTKTCKVRRTADGWSRVTEVTA